MGLFSGRSEQPVGQTSEAEILTVLRQVQDPDLHKDIVSLEFIKDIRVNQGDVSFTIELTTPACPVRDQMKQEAHRLVSSLPGVKNVQIQMTSSVRATASPTKEKLIPHVKNIIPVASGKGGVGKSTVSANIALALARTGARVGLMDADVYGPSIPLIMGIKEPPKQINNRLIPPQRYGIKIISMGFFVPETEAVIWRGPMLHKMVEQFLGNVEWGELDYLIVDLAPGTGDTQLSLCQMVPLTGAVIISTPQDVAIKVAQKAILMFDKLNCPILGMVENMSHFLCSHCGQREEIFGSGGAQKAAERFGIPFLGRIPLLTAIRMSADQGDPIVHADPESPIAKEIQKVAENLAAQVSIQNIQRGTKMVPSKIGPTNQSQLQVDWSDGHQSIYSSRELRIACPCAECVNEITGERRLDPNTISTTIVPAVVNTVGRYALQIQWSDGHSTGLYGFEFLRKFCSCSKCRSR